MKKKIVIIGAGVLGCNLVHELTRRGAAVTLIDAAEAGTGTSSATFAWVNANGKSPDAYYHLNFLGLQAHQRAARSAGQPQWFHQVGTLHIAETDTKMAAIELQVQKLLSVGYEATLLTPQEVKALEPALALDRLAGGVLYPKEGWIDVEVMCSSLLQRAMQAGAVYVPFETVTDLQPRQVSTKTGEGMTRHYAADVVILAAGNGNRRILARQGIDFPTLDPAQGDGTGSAEQPNIGLISTTGTIDSGMKHVVITDAITLRPARNGGITFTDIPTGGEWDIDSPEIWTVPALQLERARQLYPALRNTFTESVSLGRRVLPEDGLTIADWVNEEESIYAVATHSGVTLAAHLGEVIADEVLTGDRHQSLEPFGLSRFASA